MEKRKIIFSAKVAGNGAEHQYTLNPQLKDDYKKLNAC